MKRKPILFIACVVLGVLTERLCERLCSQPTNPPAKLQSSEAAKRPAPTFADGVQFSLIAAERNRDVHDLETLYRIAFNLWQNALARQQQAMMATNAVPTNAPPATNSAASTNAERQHDIP